MRFPVDFSHARHAQGKRHDRLHPDRRDARRAAGERTGGRAANAPARLESPLPSEKANQ